MKSIWFERFIINFSETIFNWWQETFFERFVVCTIRPLESIYIFIFKLKIDRLTQKSISRTIIGNISLLEKSGGKNLKELKGTVAYYEWWFEKPCSHNKARIFFFSFTGHIMIELFRKTNNWPQIYKKRSSMFYTSNEVYLQNKALRKRKN